MVDEHDGLGDLIQLGIDKQFAVGRDGRVAPGFSKCDEGKGLPAGEFVKEQTLLALRLVRDEIDARGPQCPIAPTVEAGSFHHKDFFATARGYLPDFVGV